MKITFTLLFITLSSAAYSQIQATAFVNSSAISQNTSCGIGEIFIVPTKTLDEEELIPLLDDVPNQDNEIENQNLEIVSVIAYPNPTSGIVYIQTNQDIKLINIYGPEGKWVKDVDISKNNNIDLTIYQSGTYTLILAETNLKPLKVIKQ